MSKGTIARNLFDTNVTVSCMFSDEPIVWAISCKRKDFALGLSNRTEALSVVRRSQDIRGQPCVRPGVFELSRFWLNLFLNILRLNQLVELSDVLDKRIHDFRIE